MKRGAHYNRSNRKSGGPRRVHLGFSSPALRDFAQWLIQVAEVRAKYGSEIAKEFVIESRRRFEMTDPEYDFAMSIAEGEE